MTDDLAALRSVATTVAELRSRLETQIDAHMAIGDEARAADLQEVERGLHQASRKLDALLRSHR